MPRNADPGSAPPLVRGDADTEAAEVDPFPDWFSQFLDDRQTRKPSAHTMKAYRQDFIAIATLVAGGDPSRLAVADITKDSMRTAFAGYARDHEAASIRRCRSTWNVRCTFVFTGELLEANPMSLVGRPKLARPLPKALPRSAVEALLETVAQDRNSKRQTDWAERDLALIRTALLGGLRADELCQVDVGDIRTTDDGSAVIHVKGKAARSQAFPLRLNCFRLLRPILTAVPSGSPPLLSEKRMRRARPYRNGLCDRHCSSGATANASPVERCSRALNEHDRFFDAPGISILTIDAQDGRQTDIGISLSSAAARQLADVLVMAADEADRWSTR